ncbi:MAG: ferredoxin [Clostridium sp.]
MKQISVNKKCSGCGLCIVNCHYLQENAEGDAEVVDGTSIKDKDIESVKKIIAECPEHALHIVETGSTNKKGHQGVADIIAELKSKCNSFSVNIKKSGDLKFKKI